MGGSPYIGKLTADDREFFNNRKAGKTIHKDDRIKPEKDKAKKTGKKSG